jgi:N,N'-diacetyllegionaminate synthase
MENTGIVSQNDLFKEYEINQKLHGEIFKYIESFGLDWFSIPTHETDVELLEEFNVKLHKIVSDDAVKIPLLKYVAEKETQYSSPPECVHCKK